MSASRQVQVMGTEINLVDPDVYQRGGVPHEALRWLREHAPVFWHADGGAPGWPGFWAVTRREKHIKEICDGLIDDVAVRGTAEFVRDIAAPLPLYVICELMGAPVADRMGLFALSSRLAGFDDPDFRA